MKDFGRGQVTAVIHAVFLEPPDRRPALMIAYKHLFASHYFQARLALTGLFAVAKEGEPAGPVLVYVDRMLFDGQPNRLVRRMIVRRALEDVRGRLISLRAHLGG